MSFAAAAGLVVGAGTAIYSGIKQKQQAAQLAKNNPYPQQDVPQAEKDNQQLAKQMANQGLPSQEYAAAMQNIQRQRTAAMRNASDRRGGLGLIGQIQANADTATARLDAANANARLQNQRGLIGVNNQVAGYQQRAFDWNSKNKYNQNYNYSQQLQGAGNSNIVHGIDEIGSGLIQGAARGLFGKSSYATTPGMLNGAPSSAAGIAPVSNYAAPNVSAGAPGGPLDYNLKGNYYWSDYINGNYPRNTPF